MDDPDTAPRRATSAPVADQSPFPDPSLVPVAPTRGQRLRGPLLTAGIVGGVTIALHFRDPHVSGSWGGCPWLALTGQYCPACGGLRAVNDLTNVDLVAAASSNLLFVLAVPALLLGWLRWIRREWSGAPAPARARLHAGVWVGLFAVAAVVFGVLRNLAWGSWLAP